jgi:DNA-binding NtrC family response regulator
MTNVSVLLVDDEVPFVETLTKRLQKRALDITAVYDGASALEKLDADSKLEVVILDVKMPGMDGVETLRQVKTLHPLVEVIMLTGHATVETAIEGMKLGAFDYLLKPCDIDVLVTKVEEAAARKRDHEEKIVQARIKEIANRRA